MTLFELEDTTDTDMSASYIGLHLEIDSESRLRTKLYNKTFNFHIVNFPFISVDMVLQSLQIISGFLWLTIVDSEKATEPRVSWG